jgi:hypothetical protein
MIALRARSLALGCALLAAPLVGAAAATSAPQPAPAGEDTANDQAAAEDKIICRYVKLETASRRKTKVCRTTEEWRALNNPR